MAFKHWNSLRLIKEYCCKPKDKQCPFHQTCYNDEFQCRYWKQVFKRPSDDYFTIRQGSDWYTGVQND